MRGGDDECCASNFFGLDARCATRCRLTACAAVCGLLFACGGGGIHAFNPAVSRTVGSVEAPRSPAGSEASAAPAEAEWPPAA